MAELLTCKTISVSIARNWREVYDFVASPENLPLWASGLAKSLRQVDGEWIADAPEGPVKVRFAGRNDLGVLDHHVIPEPGVEIYVPLRVIANGNGSEILFTLFHLPEVSDEIFARDLEWVARDLDALKALLEDNRE